jgi:hypothetical protein
MNLNILDTGYISDLPLGSQTQLTPADRAGFNGTTSVFSIPFDTESISFQENFNFEGEPVLNNYDPYPVMVSSSKNPIIPITIIEDKQITETNHEYNNLDTLRRFQHTKGLKLLYPSAIGDPNIIEALGVRNNGFFHSATPSTTNGTILTDTPYFAGKIKNFRIADSTTSKWRITFDFEVTCK